MKFSLLPPAVIIYTDRLPKRWADGWCWGFVITIRPNHRHNQGLLEHELFHSAQFWMTLGLHGLLYRFVPRYRYWSEIWAYRRQIRHQPGTEQRYADIVATFYDLDIDAAQALRDLTKK
jgi:hypothetical protein